MRTAAAGPRADQAEAGFWAGVVRNRNLNEATRGWGAAPVAGGFALAAPDGGLDAALGAGSARPLTADDLAIVHDFYAARGLVPAFDLRDDVARRDGELLIGAGYRPEGRTRVLEGALAGAPAAAPRTAVAVRRTTDRTRWIEGYAAACGDPGARARGTFLAGSARALFAVADADGHFVAVAAYAAFGGAAMLFGAATRAEARGRGYHRALVAARLEAAVRDGAAWAFAVAEPGGTAERTLAALGLAGVALRERYRRHDV